ncbi:hypothetical protein PBI_RACCOON_7 [Microbacterium phage Raccoon]|uniref:Uncharacterized protein n=1 Tax=Microbacterium phage Raccoon TaxID=2079590 RepID=A0A2L0HND5_9CAUD|nr:hypothetical protein PBI_RACCOON_7 [Microbacterium phage Raccoon]
MDEVVVEVQTPSRRPTQAEYDANRREVKARAAKTIEANAKAAKKAKDKAIAARNVDLGQRAALSGAAAIEKRINDRAKARAEETS